MGQLPTVIDKSTLLLAIAIGVIMNAQFGLIFAIIAKKYGIHEATRPLVCIYLASQPAKYIPGKIWPTVIQSVALGTRENLTRTAATNMELSIIATLHVFTLASACLIAQHSWIFAALALTVGALATTALSITPSDRLLRAFERKMKLKLPQQSPNLAGAKNFWQTSAMLNLSALVTNAVGSWCVLVAIGDTIPEASRMPVLAALYLGFVTSLFALPVPAGVGVREAATVGIGLVLAPEISASSLIAVALLARFWQVLVDAISFIFALVMRRTSIPPTETCSCQ